MDTYDYDEEYYNEPKEEKREYEEWKEIDDARRYREWESDNRRTF